MRAYNNYELHALKSHIQDPYVLVTLTEKSIYVARAGVVVVYLKSLYQYLTEEEKKKVYRGKLEVKDKEITRIYN